MKSALFFAVLLIAAILSSCAYRGDFSKRKYLNLKSKSQVEIAVQENINFAQELNSQDSMVALVNQPLKTVDLPVGQAPEVAVTSTFEPKEIRPNEHFIIEKYSVSMPIKTTGNSRSSFVSKNSINYFKTKANESKPKIWRIIGGILLALVVAIAGSFVILLILSGLFLIWLLFFSW